VSAFGCRFCVSVVDFQKKVLLVLVCWGGLSDGQQQFQTAGLPRSVLCLLRSSQFALFFSSSSEPGLRSSIFPACMITSVRGTLIRKRTFGSETGILTFWLSIYVIQHSTDKYVWRLLNNLGAGSW